MATIDDDPIVSVLPIHLSTSLAPNVHLHQFPLLTRPLQVPPSAAQSGKKIRARFKDKAARLEIHVPVDSRKEVFNRERGEEMGKARATDDAENSSGKKANEDVDQRLSEIRLRSEQVTGKGAYMLGIVRDGQLHLHPINQTHQLRPTLTYMDVLSRKSSRKSKTTDSDSDSDEGPPPDPDEPVSAPAAPVKKEPKTSGAAREVTVSIRKAENQGTHSMGGMTTARREMLHQLREEEEEDWADYEYCDGESEEAGKAFEAVFSKSNEKLRCDSQFSSFLKNIPGL